MSAAELAEIVSLRRKLAEKDQEVVALTSALKDRGSQVVRTERLIFPEEAKQSNDTKDAEIARLLVELEKARNTRAPANNAEADLLRTKLIETEREGQELRQSNTELQNQLARFRSEVRNLSDEVEALRRADHKKVMVPKSPRRRAPHSPSRDSLRDEFEPWEAQEDYRSTRHHPPAYYAPPQMPPPQCMDYAYTPGFTQYGQTVYTPISGDSPLPFTSQSGFGRGYDWRTFVPPSHTQYRSSSPWQSSYNPYNNVDVSQGRMRRDLEWEAATYTSGRKRIYSA